MSPDPLPTPPDDELGVRLARALREACRGSSAERPAVLMLTAGRSSRVLLALAARDRLAVRTCTAIGPRSPVAERRVPPALAAHADLPWRAVPARGTGVAAELARAGLVAGRSAADLAAGLHGAPRPDRPGDGARGASPYDDPAVRAALADGDSTVGGIAARLDALLAALCPALAGVPVDPPDASFGWWDGALANRRAWWGLLPRAVALARAPRPGGHGPGTDALPMG